MRSIPPSATVILAALAAAGCAAPAAGGRAPVDPRTMVPPEVRREWLHFAEPVVSVGDAAPGFALPTPDGSAVLSLDLYRGRPLVLLFGSWT